MAHTRLLTRRSPFPSAKLRAELRRILNKHGYPPDLREEATTLVLEQAQLLCADWAAG